MNSAVSSTPTLDTLTTAVVGVGGDGSITLINAAAEHLLGVSRRTVLGQALGHQATLHSLQARVATAQRSDTPIIAHELSLPRMGDAPLSVDVIFTPYKDGVLIELRPVEYARKVARDTQRSAQLAASREVVRGLAHEIKNPLGGIRGAAQLLQRELPPDLQDYTRVIMGEADRLQALVNKLLGPSRPPSLARVNIHEALEHVRLLNVVQHPQAHIQRDYDPSLPDVLADRDQLVQILLNVVGNAAEAGASLITLRTRALRQALIAGVRHRVALQAEVIDNGQGIPPEQIERIFFPLVTTKTTGTGLGLAITQQLVAAHGGVIECESRAGHTRFVVLLPL